MTSLTKKERTRRALWRLPVDRPPVQTNYTGAMGAKLAARFRSRLEDLPERLGNHLLRVDVAHCPRLSADGAVSFDWWGAGWSTATEGYWHTHAPLAESTALAAYPWPDPDARSCWWRRKRPWSRTTTSFLRFRTLALRSSSARGPCAGSTGC